MINPYFWFVSKLLVVLIVCDWSIVLPLFTLEIVLLLLLIWVLFLWFPSQLKFGDCFSSNGLRLLVSDACNYSKYKLLHFCAKDHLKIVLPSIVLQSYYYYRSIHWWEFVLSVESARLTLNYLCLKMNCVNLPFDHLPWPNS